MRSNLHTRRASGDPETIVTNSTNTATSVSRSTVANEEGFYRFDAVDLDTYSIKFTAPGFGAVVKNNIVVSANQTASVDAQLAPGTQELSVDVTAEAGALLQTEAMEER